MTDNVVAKHIAALIAAPIAFVLVLMASFGYLGEPSMFKSLACFFGPFLIGFLITDTGPES